MVDYHRHPNQIPSARADQYEPGYDYSGYQSVNPGKPVPGSELDDDFTAIAYAVATTQDRLRLIQNDDGSLGNESVGAGQIDAGTWALLMAIGAGGVYLGQLSGPPTTRGDGSPLQVGDSYYNTVLGQLQLFDGSNWQQGPGVANAQTLQGLTPNDFLQVLNDLSDLDDVVAARGNLGLSDAFGLADVVSGFKADVDAYDALVAPSWEGLEDTGPEGTVSGMSGPALCGLTSSQVALFDEANGLSAYNVGAMTKTGTTLSVSATGVRLAAMSGGSLALLDNGGDSLTTYRFDGSVWTKDGSVKNITGMVNGDVATLSSTKACVADESSGLQMYEFTSGTGWAGNGAAYALSGSKPVVVALSGSVVAARAGSGALQAYEFDGAAWAPVGAGVTVTSNECRLIAVGRGDVGVQDVTTNTVQVYRFDGEAWTVVSAPMTLGGSGDVCTTAVNGTDIMRAEDGTGTLQVRRMRSELGRPWSPLNSSWS